MRLKFGTSTMPAKERKTPKSLHVGTEDGDVKCAVSFNLCATCVKKVQKNLVTPSAMFAIACEDCKKRFLQIANKRDVIGGLVKLF